MGYRKCIIYFIDILGSQDRDDFEKTFHINEQFHKYLEVYSERDMNHTVYNRTVHTFSDCAYIIYDFKDHIENERKDIRKLARVSLYNTESLIQSFLSEGFVVRGGVTYGNVYYEKERSLIFGPGINRAYYLEDKIAKVPRIIIDQCVEEMVSNYENEDFQNDILNKDFDLMLEKKKINGRIIRQDSDGLFYLNYFNTIETGIFSETSARMIESLRKLIDQSLLTYSSETSILDKYIWLKNYLENSIPTNSIYDY